MPLTIFIDQLLTMGLPAIDDSLMRLLEAMNTFPKSAILGNTIGFADDDAWPSRHGCDETPPYRRTVHLYFM